MRVQRKGNALTPLVGMHIGAAALENNMEVSQETKNSTTLQPGSCTGSLSQKNTKIGFEGAHTLYCLQQHYQQ